MPQRYNFSIAKPSEVRKTEPILCILRTLSNTTITGSFSCSLNSSTPTRFSSSNFNFFMDIHFVYDAFLRLKNSVILKRQN
ncbi:hypothetical protein D3C71_2072000 [compost metagenome]